MEWVLILYIYAGVLAKGDSVALTTVPMESLEACRRAGEASSPLIRNSTKEIRYACVRNK